MDHDHYDGELKKLAEIWKNLSPALHLGLIYGEHESTDGDSPSGREGSILRTESIIRNHAPLHYFSHTTTVSILLSNIRY